MGFGLKMNALISLSVFNKMNECLDYKGAFFFLLHTLLFLCFDKFDLLDIVFPQSSQV